MSSTDHRHEGREMDLAELAKMYDFNGRAVVVKVQRPGIRAHLAEDIEFFRELARFLVGHTSAGASVVRRN